MNFNVVYIYTAEVCPHSAGSSARLTAGFRIQILTKRLLLPSGISHCGTVPGDGLLYLVQSDRWNDRTIHRTSKFSVLL